MCVAIVHIMGYQIVATEMQKRKKIARMNISAPKISTKNAYFATFGNLRQNKPSGANVCIDIPEK